MASGAPLHCWDIFMEGYHRKLQLLESFSQLNQIAKRNRWKVEWNMEQELLAEHKVIIVTDITSIIRFASLNMVEMNGYQPAEVIGKSPAIFQGKDTSLETRTEIRQAIIKRIPFRGSILNYRKNGTIYHCAVEEYPVWNKKGELVNFIAFEKVA